MLEDKIYQRIEQYINNELTAAERIDFEVIMASNSQIAQTVTLYQNLPKRLENISENLDYNEKLEAVALQYRQERTFKSFIRRLLIGIGILLLLLLAWWFFQQNTSQTPQNIPYATLWKNTEKPPATIIRGGNIPTMDEEHYQKAYQFFGNQAFDLALTQLDSISTNTTIYPYKLLLQGVCEYEVKNYSQAAAIYEQYLNLNTPNLVEDLALWYQALAYLQTPDFDAARQNLQEIIDKDYSKKAEAKKILDLLE